jgi:two-component SAPR family response regulator
MRGFIFLTSIFFFITAAYGQSHGLQFSSHEVVPEKRTSLNLTPNEPFCLNNSGEISFQLNFRPDLEIYFGYIMRVVTSNKENIDLVYNQRLRNFNFVIGEAFSGVFEIDSAKLFGEWNDFSVRFNHKSKEVSFYLNNKFISKGKANFDKQPCYKVFFGTNNYESFQTVDIPPMNIRDIRIKEDGKEIAYYPLLESEGNISSDIKGKRSAAVKNPVWIKPRHQNWQQVHTFDTRGSASVAFDQQKEMLYFISTDTLYHLSLKNMQPGFVKLSKNRDTLPPGNQSVFDPFKNRLYNFYIDEQKVSTYNPESRSWDHNFSHEPLTVYWQANKFLSSVDSALYIFGGYGQLQYKNTVQRYHFPDNKWEIIQATGDSFMPRYLAGLGANSRSDTAFIIGGYGSSTGDQTINPKYNYDLMAFSVKDHSFHRIYHLKEPARPFCFANSLVIDEATNSFYGLTYPNDRFNSVLQLMRGSLSAPTYEFMGDSIPYSFYDVKSFADLYYSPAAKKLVAVTMYTAKNDITSIKVFTIDFPPNQLTNKPSPTANGKEIIYLLVGAVLLAATALTYFLIGKKRKSREVIPSTSLPQPEQPAVIPAPMLPEPEPQESLTENRLASSIFLFGQFEVFDKEGVDITNRFTPLIRELLLLILVYTFRDGRGISSEQLFDILWSDKSAKDAKNNYSVNIVKLKHILEKVGDCHFTKESGKWKLEVVNDSIKIDYQHYSALTAGKSSGNKVYIQELLSVVGRGAFLPTVHYEWLDDIKSTVSSQVIDILLKFLPTADPVKEAEFIARVANCVFFFDQLNEEALLYKCRALIVLGRHGIAKEAYMKFSKEYNENYGHPYQRSFADITQQP